MANELRANPDVLAQLGIEMAGHGESLADLQRSCHRDADSAQHGWVGSSAGALSGLLKCWATATSGHVARFDEHSAGMQSAAAVFTEMEQRNADILR